MKIKLPYMIENEFIRLEKKLDNLETNWLEKKKPNLDGHTCQIIRKQLQQLREETKETIIGIKIVADKIIRHAEET